MADLPAPGHAMQFGYALDWTGTYGNNRSAIATVVNTYLVSASYFGVDGPGLADLAADFADAQGSGKTVMFSPHLNESDGSMTADALAGLDAIAGDWPCDGVLFDKPGGSTGTKAFIEGLLASWATALSDRTLATVPIYVNYSGTALRTATGKEAAGIDVMGFDAYLDVSLQDQPHIADMMTAEVQALKLIVDATDPGRDKFMVLQGNDRNGLWMNLENLRNIQAPPYLECVGDATCVANFVFSWQRPGGTQSLPDCIRTEHERIFGAINATAQPLTISCSSPPPFHSGRKLYLVRSHAESLTQRYFISRYRADDLVYETDLFTIDAGAMGTSAYLPGNISEGPLTPASNFGRLAFFSGPTSGTALVYIYEADGTFVRSFDSGCTVPTWIYYGPDGTIYIAEDILDGAATAPQLQQFTDRGGFMNSWTVDGAGILNSFVVQGGGSLATQLYWIDGASFPSQINTYTLTTSSAGLPITQTYQPEWIGVRAPDSRLIVTTWFSRVFHVIDQTGSVANETYNSTAIEDYFTQGQMKGRFIWLHTISTEPPSALIRCTKCEPNTAAASLEPNPDISYQSYFFLVTGANEVILPCPGPPPVGTRLAMRRSRTFTLAYDDNKEIEISRIEFICQTGIGNAASPDPVIMIELSKDGGYTYGTPLFMSVGSVGQYPKRVYLNRLGRGRNWVCRMSTADPNAFGFMECNIEATVGTS